MTKHTVTMRELADRLPAAVDYARTDRHAHVIVSCGGPYVQLAFPDGWVLGEAVSNHYLEASHRLTTSDEVLLDILGWDRPGVDRDGDFHHNFVREWHDDTPSEVIAQDMIRTLTAVYMHAEVGPVGLDVFACESCAAATERRAFGDAVDDRDDDWRCGRCATVNAADKLYCDGCGLPKQASV